MSWVWFPLSTAQRMGFIAASESGGTYWRSLDKLGGVESAAPHAAGNAGLYQLPTAEWELQAS